MKSSKLTKVEREIRREEIMFDRTRGRRAYAERGITTIQYKTTRKVFGKSGKVSHDYGPYPHSSERQRARYARQLAAGQLRIVAVAAPEKATADYLLSSGSKDFLAGDYGDRRFMVVDPSPEPVKKPRAKKATANV